MLLEYSVGKSAMIFGTTAATHKFHRIIIRVPFSKIYCLMDIPLMIRKRSISCPSHKHSIKAIISIQGENRNT